MKNLSLIIGLLSTIILSLYCIDFHTEPILQKLNYQISQKNSSNIIKQQSYVETISKPIAPEKSQANEESELDRLTKEILEDMKKNKDNKWRQ